MRAALDELNDRLFRGKDLRSALASEFTCGCRWQHRSSPQRYNYTVIGDGVNVAARLQTLTRNAAYAADIIVSDATLREGTGSFRTRLLGETTVKGKQQSVIIHALLGPS
jgi:class 3 adenylate cyclase